MMKRAVLWTLCAVSLTCAVGCGLIADKDRIVIARVNGEPFRRGDLSAVLRAMPDEERPNIVNKGDLIEVLRDHIDGEIKLALGQKMLSEGRIDVPRERAEAAYFETHPDLQPVRTITDPTSLGMSPQQLAAMKEEVELGVDRVYDAMLGEAAVHALSAEYLEQGKIVLANEDLQQEYELQKDSLKNLETLGFIGLRFPAAMPNAEVEAARVRRLVDQGEPWDAILSRYHELDPGLVFRSQIENNPAAAKFRGFWVTAQGAKVGDILGPVFIPSYDLMTLSESGEQQSVTMPDAYLVFEVLEYTPESQMTLEEAKDRISPGILYLKTIKKLREENGVEIYENKLPDPGMYSNSGSPLAQ